MPRTIPFLSFLIVAFAFMACKKSGSTATSTSGKVYGLLPASGTGDGLTFMGGPIRIHWQIEIFPTAVTTDYTFGYEGGKVIAAGVQVATPAGDFTCSEWVYSKLLNIQSPLNNSTQSYADTLWTSPGTPFVKSSEASGGVYTVTLLSKIN